MQFLTVGNTVRFLWHTSDRNVRVIQWGWCYGINCGTYVYDYKKEKAVTDLSDYSQHTPTTFSSLRHNKQSNKLQLWFCQQTHMQTTNRSSAFQKKLANFYCRKLCFTQAIKTGRLKNCLVSMSHERFYWMIKICWQNHTSVVNLTT